MFYKNILYLIICICLSNCNVNTLNNNKPNTNTFNGYLNKGFALVYSEKLYSQKIINKKIDERSLIIFQKNLKMRTPVKVTNILNNKSLIATVGKNSNYPSFNNSVISLRIAQELELDIDQPYVEILEIVENSIFVAKKAKTYDEEKNVAVKAPVTVNPPVPVNVATVSPPLEVNDLIVIKDAAVLKPTAPLPIV